MASSAETAAPEALFAARPLTEKNRTELRSVLDDFIHSAEHDRLPLKVPREVKPGQRLPGMHYHYRPEFFLQLQGSTAFQCPRETFQLNPNEACIMPAGVPHGEVVHPGPTLPFRNLVVGFYNHTISLHFAFEAQPRKPDIEVIEFFDAPNLDVFLTLANQLVHAHGMRTPSRDSVIKGLLIALLGMFRDLVEAGGDRLNGDIGKVFQAKCLVRERFANPKLGVQQIAATLGCSRDYLSHLFHVETKERLTRYIQRIRVKGAVLALESTALNVSEIAYASGFADPAYFARVFKQHTGLTPIDYRRRIDARRNRREAKPKTVYFDRLDFSAGKPHEATEASASQPTPAGD